MLPVLKVAGYSHYVFVEASPSRAFRDGKGRFHFQISSLQIRRQKFVEEKMLKQSERNFDGDDHRDGLSAGPIGGLEAPLLYCFHSFFFEPKARALHHLNFRGAAIRSDHCLQDDGALVFCLAGFFRIFRIRAIDARRIANAARPRMICSAAGTAAGTRA
jgi:hypothetical protein